MICTKCKIEKDLSNFAFRKDTNRYRGQCRDCVNLRQEDVINAWCSRNPWYVPFNNARQRCIYNPSYAKKGIKSFLTLEEVKDMWFRDRAYLMKRPSIDRINSNGNYEIKNCRFIETLENNRLALLGRVCTKEQRIKIKNGIINNHFKKKYGLIIN